MNTPIYSTPAVLVTGADDKGNEYCHQYARDTFMDLYNEVYITAGQFRALYPIVQKVYFGEVEMTGDQWRDIQCPLSMTREQIEQWRENVQYVDVWVDPQPKETAIDFWKNPDGSWKPFRSWASYPRQYSEPLSAEEVDDNRVGQ